MEQDTLRVQRQVSRINGEVTEAPLKTKNSYRTISRGADAVGILKDQRRKCGRSPYVFPSLTGGPISPDSVLQIPVWVKYESENDCKNKRPEKVMKIIL